MNHPFSIQSLVGHPIQLKTREARLRVIQNLFLIVFVLYLALQHFDIEKVNLFTRLRYQVLHDRVMNNVLIGKQSWLFYTAEQALDGYQQVSIIDTQQLSILHQELLKIQQLLNENQIQFLVVVVPDKASVYPEFLPDEVSRVGNQSALDQFMSYTQSHPAANILDLRSALSDCKSVQPIYYRTDTHWNPIGAHCGSQVILERLNLQKELFTPYTVNDFNYPENQSAGDLAKFLDNPDLNEKMLSVHPLFEDLTVQTRVDPSNFRSTILTQHPDQSLPTLLMYRDSFSSGLIPFMKFHFRQATFIWSFDLDENYILDQKPDFVILELTERYLPVLFSNRLSIQK